MPGTPAKDRFGNLVPGPGEWRSVPVAGWAIEATQESEGDSLLRTIDELKVYVPASEVMDAASRVRLPDGAVWDVQGNVLNYENGPWASPGLVVVRARKVEG